MLVNIRRFAIVGVSLATVLTMAACAVPPSAPAVSATTAVTTAATDVATEAVAATEEATTAATGAMTTTAEATTAATGTMTATEEATTVATGAMTTTAEATTAATGAMTTTGTAIAQMTINVGDSTLGKILTDGAGRTLYVFTKDTAGASTCYAQCAQNWPPLLTTGSPKASAGSDVDSTLLGTTTRTDGMTQVTYKGMPLYYFAKDTAAGDVKGQGVGDVWYAVAPTGEMIDKS